MDTLRTTFLLAFLNVTIVSAGTALHGVEGALPSPTLGSSLAHSGIVSAVKILTVRIARAQ